MEEQNFVRGLSQFLNENSLDEAPFVYKLLVLTLIPKPDPAKPSQLQFDSF